MIAILKLFGPQIAIGAVILFGVWWIQNEGYERAQADRAKTDAAFVAKFEARLEAIDNHMATDVARVDRTETIIRPTLIREIQSDPRFSDPATGITDGMLRGINTARATSCPAGADCNAMPAASNAD